VLAAGLLLWLSGACGYHAPGGDAGGRPAPAVHLAPLGNDTFRPGIQGLLAAAIQRQLTLGARIPVVDEAVAEILLSGRVTGYQNEALAFDRSDIGRRFRLRVVVALTGRGRTDNRVRVEGRFTGEAYYTTGDTVQATRAAEDDAARRAAQEVAELVAARLLEEW
jgi:hypothetical protein